MSHEVSNKHFESNKHFDHDTRHKSESHTASNKLFEHETGRRNTKPHDTSRLHEKLSPHDSADNSVCSVNTGRSSTTMFGGKKIVGDLFGTNTNFDSLGYRSRVEMMLKMQADAKKDKKDSLEREILASSAASVVSVEFNSDSESESDITEALSQKQQLAVTIRNWAALGRNDDKLINEGGIQALISLASVDDTLVKKSCASAFCYLSSRQQNRSQLIKLGAVSGVITIAMSVRTWKTAKSCAMCLCNLSMEPGGEGVMAREGAILAIAILMGIKNQRLLPICVHTLYNMTCVDQHFKGMDRIAKAMLNVPTTAFDHTHFLIKALVNCSRYSWMRNRMIEDGVINAFTTLVGHVTKRSNSREYVLHMLICLAYLGESSTQCRVDMLQRGTIELLSNLAVYCDDDECRFYVVKVIHNTLEIVKMMSMTIYETSVNVTVEALQSVDDDLNTIQYACSCLLIFTKDHMRGVPYLNDLVLDCMSQLLTSEDPLTQYFGLTCSGNIFERNTCKSTKDLEAALKLIIDGGQSYRDPLVIQALAITIAKMATEPKCQKMMDRLNLLPGLLEKLLILVEICAYSTRILEAAKATKTNKKMSKMFGDDSAAPSRRSDSAGMSKSSSIDESEVDPRKPSASMIATTLGIKLDKAAVAIVQECACTAITRVALVLGANLQATSRMQLAKLLTDFLAVDDYSVVSNTIIGIRSLGERGLCEDELRSDTLFTRVANIVRRHSSDLSLCRNCCAILWIFSYNTASHSGLAVNSVMEVLFQTTSAEDSVTRELVAATLCNMSVNVESRIKMIGMGVVRVLETLSGTTSGLIQELCAKCLCNLTCSEECHELLIENQCLQILIMIALLRAVAPATKLLCAKALLNLSTVKNYPVLEETGAIRIFATLAGIESPEIQHTCARGFLVISGMEQQRHDIVQRRTVVQSLYSLLKCESAQTRIMAGMAVCNILACPSTQGAALSAGGLSVLKIIATMDYEELREATVRAILTLLNNTSLHSQIAKEPVTQILVLIAQQSTPVTFECAVNAFMVMSQSDVFRMQLIEKGCISAMVHAVIAGKINSLELAQSLCRCFCLLSYYYKKAELMIIRGHILIALHAFYHIGYCAVSSDLCSMIALTLQNFSRIREVRAQLIEQDGFKLLVSVSKHFSTDYTLTFRATVHFVYNLSLEKSLHRRLVEQGFMEMLLNIAEGARSTLLNEEDVLHIATMLNMITATPECRAKMGNAGIVQIIGNLLSSLNATSCKEMISALCNLASSRECRAYLVEQGAADLIIKLSELSNEPRVRELCTLALSYLSEITALNDGVIKSYLKLNVSDEAGAKLGDNAGADGTGGELTKSGKLKKLTGGLLLTMRMKQLKPDNPLLSRALGSAGGATGSAAGGKDVSSYTGVGGELMAFDDEERKLLLETSAVGTFRFIEYAASVEPGGMAAKFKINLPLPAISSGSSTENSDRLNDLPKFVVNQDSLEKVTTLITDFKSLGLPPHKGHDDDERRGSDIARSDVDSDTRESGSKASALGGNSSTGRDRSRSASFANDDVSDAPAPLALSKGVAKSFKGLSVSGGPKVGSNRISKSFTQSGSAHRDAGKGQRDSAGGKRDSHNSGSAKLLAGSGMPSHGRGSFNALGKKSL